MLNCDSTMIFTDQLHRAVSIPQWPPRRIVSLVPSQTELLYTLGLGQQVVGITRFCVQPMEWFREKSRVGGTKTLNLHRIAALQPDLLLGNKEENDRAQMEALAERWPVWMSDVATLTDAYEMIWEVGKLTDKEHSARQLVADIQMAFDQNQPNSSRVAAAYFIWKKPYMVAASGTFIHEMLDLAGFQNVFSSQTRYPEIKLDELAAAQPHVILLSSEPYPFSKKHFAAFQEVCPNAHIQLVDGEMFSWYGSRLLFAPTYFRNLFAEISSHSTSPSQ